MFEFTSAYLLELVEMYESTRLIGASNQSFRSASMSRKTETKPPSFKAYPVQSNFSLYQVRVRYSQQGPATQGQDFDGDRKESLIPSAALTPPSSKREWPRYDKERRRQANLQHY